MIRNYLSCYRCGNWGKITKAIRSIETDRMVYLIKIHGDERTASYASQYMGTFDTFDVFDVCAGDISLCHTCFNEMINWQVLIEAKHANI